MAEENVTQTQLDRELRHLATREDMARLESKIESSNSNTIKWVVGVGIAVFLGVVGIMNLLS